MHPCPEKKWLQSGVRSCIMPGLPTHLVQELNVGTVGTSLYTTSVPQLKPKINTLYIFFLMNVFDLNRTDSSYIEYKL